MKIAAIIPAFNEEKSIGPIIRVAKKHPLVDEVIVVDDGSSDATAKISRQEGARIIQNKKNQGKGRAMERGVESTNADILLFLDADLLGLGKKHLDALLEPVIKGQADMTVGAVDRSGIGPYLNQWLSRTESPFSGMRAIKRFFWEAIPSRYKKVFYVESVITYLAKNNKFNTKPFILEGVKHIVKEKKLGFWEGSKARWKMHGQIIWINLALRLKPHKRIKI